MKTRLMTILLAVLAVAAGCKNVQKAPETAVEEEQTEQTEMETTEITPDVWENLGEEPVLEIKTTDGTMKIKLYSETPLHRDNFIKLARQGYYDGILFHRIISGFMIQTGDPYSKDSTKIALVGTGGPGYNIPAEIVSGKTHKKGALAAARRGDSVNPAKESSGSQFYIVQDEEGCKHLDGEYSIFGEVIDGMEVIDKIAAEPTDQRDRPLGRVAIVSVKPGAPSVE